MMEKLGDAGIEWGWGKMEVGPRLGLVEGSVKSLPSRF
jgi:hypothetical protein